MRRLDESHVSRLILCDRKGNRENQHGIKPSSIPPSDSPAPWRLVALSLGVLCLSLLVTVGILGLNGKSVSLRIKSIQSQPSNVIPFRECCYSGSCPEKWIWHRGNCYYLSREEKNWSESQTHCSKRWGR
uniref:C-type lectin domain-containing protein n=1 Tax=Ornithorhynchus anatinus TaxID=9258 RepID=A0A6I8N522_ORNAN